MAFKGRETHRIIFSLPFVLRTFLLEEIGIYDDEYHCVLCRARFIGSTIVDKAHLAAHAPFWAKIGEIVTQTVQIANIRVCLPYKPD